VKRDIGQVSDCCPRLKKDLTNLEQELTKLKAEMRATKPAPVPPSTPPPPKPARQFPPSMKRGSLFVIPDGIIAHLKRECGGNVHDRDVVNVTCGSFEKQTFGVNYSAKDATEMETDSAFASAYRKKKEDIQHTPNNWICYNFKERRIVPTHYTIRTIWAGPGGNHLKSWLVETSADGESWREVAREERNKQLNGTLCTGTFPVAGDGECRFIRLVQIGRNHAGYDSLIISAWEIFGSLFE
jgi:hypothetical protein